MRARWGRSPSASASRPGSLHEQPHQLGWAHLVEHLAFRGSANFADREARHIWQQLGASFGSDTNAFTGTTQTFYQLDLPNADRAKLDRSLHVMADMMSSALFDPAAVEAERAIVIAEKERRPELSVRVGEAGRRLFLNGLTFAGRETIGTEATLRGATAPALRAFYDRWYRPERATMVMVGDMDPAAMIALIEARFGGWRAKGAAPAEPDFGRLATPPARVAAVAYPGRAEQRVGRLDPPLSPQPQTRAQQARELEEALALTILNRRLERRARAAKARSSAPGISASAIPAPPTSRSWPSPRAAPLAGRRQRGLRDHRRCAAHARPAPPRWSASSPICAPRQGRGRGRADPLLAGAGRPADQRRGRGRSGDVRRRQPRLVRGLAPALTPGPDRRRDPPPVRRRPAAPAAALARTGQAATRRWSTALARRAGRPRPRAATTAWSASTRCPRRRARGAKSARERLRIWTSPSSASPTAPR
jgi:hypothetical protein